MDSQEANGQAHEPRVVHICERLENRDPTLKVLTLTGRDMTEDHVRACLSSLWANSATVSHIGAGSSLAVTRWKPSPVQELYFAYRRLESRPPCISALRLTQLVAQAIMEKARSCTPLHHEEDSAKEEDPHTPSYYPIHTVRLLNCQLEPSNQEWTPSKSVFSPLVHCLRSPWAAALLVLDLSHNRLGNEGARLLSLAFCDNIWELNIDESASPTSQGPNTTLQELLLASNQIGAWGAQRLAFALEGHASLRRLDLKYNPLGSDGVKALARLLGPESPAYATHLINTGRSRWVLQRLELFNTQAGSAGMWALGIALRNNTTLRELDLAQNRIGDLLPVPGALHPRRVDGEDDQDDDLPEITGSKGTDVMWSLVQAWCRTPPGTDLVALRELDLGRNALGNAGVSLLARGLAHANSRCLQVLCLAINQIGDAGARSLARALLTNQGLLRLDMENNQIGSMGAMALAEALQVNEILHGISLTMNQIGVDGLHALAQTVETHNTTLRYLQVDGTGSAPYGHKGRGDPVMIRCRLWCKLNRAGRRVVWSRPSETWSVLDPPSGLPRSPASGRAGVEAGVWPYLLARANRMAGVDALYFFLSHAAGPLHQYCLQ